MKKIRIYLVPLVLTVVAVMIFSGCAAVQENDVSDRNLESELSNNPIEDNRPGVITGF